MKKNEKPTSQVPRISVPASSAAFEDFKTMTPATHLPKITEVTKEELLSRLKNVATGWDAEIENLFALPDRLFKIEEDAATYYSKNEQFGIGKVLSDMRFGKLNAPLPEYGVVLFSTGGTAQIALIDASRNIIVCGVLFSVHDPKPKKDWAQFKTAIKSALQLAEMAKKEGGIAVFERGESSIMRLVWVS